MNQEDVKNQPTTACANSGTRLRLDGVRVLVVDDEPDVRALLDIVFRRRGARVELAASATEGRQALEAFHPHVIVSDVSMPGEDGYDFIRSVRALPKDQGGETPAAALTAHAYKEDRARAFEAGFDSHLAKPVEHEALVRTLQKLVDVGSIAGTP